MYSLSVERNYWSEHRIRMPEGLEDLHGHNWKIEVQVSGEVTDSSGIVMDFVQLGEMLDEVAADIIGGHGVENTRENRCFSTEMVAGEVFAKLKKMLGTGVKLDAVLVEEEPGCRVKYSE